MPGALKNATARAPKAEPGNKPATWILAAEDPLGGVVAELHALTIEASTIKGKIAMAEAKLKDFADDQLARSIAFNDVLPAPITIRNDGGQKVSFVVQQKATPVKPDQVEALTALVGEDHDLLQEVTTYSLNTEILGQPGVFDVVDAALTTAVKKLLQAELISTEQSLTLVTAETKMLFKPRTFDRVTSIVGSKTKPIRAFMAAMGSSLTRYFKI